MSTRFLDALHSGRVILMDGAMGTELIKRGLDPESEKAADWNLSHPDVVREIHQEYLDAGAVCLLTNTFAAPSQSENLGKDCALAVALAAKAGAASHFVFLDSGPDRKAQSAAYIVAVDDPIGDGLLAETQTGMSFSRRLVAVRIVPKLPCFISFSFRHESEQALCLQDKASPEAVAEFATKHRDRFAALGVNCGRDIGMDDIIEVVRRYRKVTDLPILARPNAGTPIRMGNQWVYPHSPKSMAARLPELIDAGATLIGGCCGTTPAHIAAFREVIDRLGVGWKP